MSSVMQDHTTQARQLIDGIAATAIVTSLMGWLPPIAAFLGIVWYLLQIYGWFEKRFAKKRNLKRRATDVA